MRAYNTEISDISAKIAGRIPECGDVRFGVPRKGELLL